MDTEKSARSRVLFFPRGGENSTRASASASAPSDGWDEAQAEIDALIVQNAALKEAEEARAPPAGPTDKVKVRHCCAKCQSDNPTMMCPLCKTKYCSAACQKAHWPVHKPLCAVMSKSLDVIANGKAGIKSREGSASDRFYNAVRLGRLSDCERIIYEERIDVNFTGDDLRSYCHVAADWGHARVISLLLSRGAIADRHDNQGNTPLTLAALNGHDLVVKTLIEHGVAVDLPTTNEELSMTALVIAASHGHASIVELLLNAGAVADRPRSDGVVSLMMAVQGGHEAVVELLIRLGGADVNRDESGDGQAIYLAAQIGHVAIVELLLNAGAVPDQRNSRGANALHKAAQNGHVKVVELLIKAGAAVDLRNSLGYTALLSAADFGYFEVAQLLLEAGADPLRPSHDGHTPLSIALENNNTLVVALLRVRIAEMDREKRNRSL